MDSSTYNRSPPPLYTLPFCAAVLGRRSRSLATAICGGGILGRPRLLGFYGQVLFQRQAIYLVTAQDLALYLSCRGAEWSTAFVERALRLHMQSIPLRSAQKYIVDTPITEWEWASDFVYHGGSGRHNFFGGSK